MDFNFFSPDIIQDPFPHYERMRQGPRAVVNDTLGFLDGAPPPGTSHGC